VTTKHLHMAASKIDAFQRLLDLLERLEGSRLHYSLGHFRDDSISVEVVVPGERWEVEFFADGSVEVEIFSSVGPAGIALEGAEAIERLFAKHADEASASRPVT
jgi:hypothetical protein